MSVDITGFGTQLILVASDTFPVALPITQFSDDADSLDFPNLDIAEGAMGINADLVTWSVAHPVAFTVNLIPSSLDQISMNILFQANRPGKGKKNVRDKITATIIYPNFRTIVLINGRMTSGTPGIGIANSGRQKTFSYSFIFENETSV